MDLRRHGRAAAVRGEGEGGGRCDLLAQCLLDKCVLPPSVAGELIRCRPLPPPLLLPPPVIRRCRRVIG